MSGAQNSPSPDLFTSRDLMLPTGKKSVVKKSARSPRKVDAASHKLKSYLHLRQTTTTIIQDTYHSRIETPAELVSLGCCSVDCVFKAYQNKAGAMRIWELLLCMDIEATETGLWLNENKAYFYGE